MFRGSITLRSLNWNAFGSIEWHYPLFIYNAIFGSYRDKLFFDDYRKRSNTEQPYVEPEWFFHVLCCLGIDNKNLLCIKLRRFILTEVTYQTAETYFRDQGKEKACPTR